MIEKIKKMEIPIISAEQSRVLWPRGDTGYNNVFHFDEKKLMEVKKDSNACVTYLGPLSFSSGLADYAVIKRTNACVIYINPLSLIKQQEIRGFAYRDSGYTFFRSTIWEDKHIFNYFREEFEEIPSPGYYLFYNIKGVVESEARMLSIENFHPAPLAIASQAMFNFKHFLFKPQHGESYFGLSYHVAKYYEDEGLGLGIGEFAVDYLKIIHFKTKIAQFEKKIILY